MFICCCFCLFFFFFFNFVDETTFDVVVLFNLHIWGWIKNIYFINHWIIFCQLNKLSIGLVTQLIQWKKKMLKIKNNHDVIRLPSGSGYVFNFFYVHHLPFIGMIFSGMSISLVFKSLPFRIILEYLIKPFIKLLIKALFFIYSFIFILLTVFNYINVIHSSFSTMKHMIYLYLAWWSTKIFVKISIVSMAMKN